MNRIILRDFLATPGDLTSPAPPAEAEPEVVPLMDEDLKLADVRFDSKVDPQLERIAEQVNQKIDLVEERLLGRGTFGHFLGE